MDIVKTLIDEFCLTRSQKMLAKVLRTNEPRVSQWKSGSRPMPIETFATLAELVRGEAEAKELTWAYVNRKVPLLEKISEGFRKLLHLGKPRRYWFRAVV